MSPIPIPQKTVLGETQWAWLENSSPSPPTCAFSSRPISWWPRAMAAGEMGQFPAGAVALYDLVARTRAAGLIVVSGDRHRAGVYRETKGTPYPIYELTSSAFNMSSGWPDPGEEPGPNRIGPTYRDDNVGMVALDGTSAGSASIFWARDDSTVLPAFRWTGEGMTDGLRRACAPLEILVLETRG